MGTTTSLYIVRGLFRSMSCDWLATRAQGYRGIGPPCYKYLPLVFGSRNKSAYICARMVAEPSVDGSSTLRLRSPCTAEELWRQQKQPALAYLQAALWL